MGALVQRDPGQREERGEGMEERGRGERQGGRRRKEKKRQEWTGRGDGVNYAAFRIN